MSGGIPVWRNAFLNLDRRLKLPDEPESGPLQDCTIDLVKPEPGQTVVVTLPKLGGQEFIEAVADQLKHRFPDNRCVVMEEGMSLSVVDRDLLSAAKQWRQATESRLRLVSNREMSDSLLPADRALFDAIDRAEGKA